MRRRVASGRARRPRSRVASGLRVAAVRGAVPVRTNTAGDIQAATARLLEELVRVNRLSPARIVSALFTTTADLDADFPAHAARRLGWGDVPMLHAREIPVPGSMERVVRVLLTLRDVPARVALKPVYLDRAAELRPDLTGVRPARGRVAPGGAARGARRFTVALIGLGQIGGSIGLALASGGRWNRIGWDAKRGVAAAALERGAIDRAAPSLEAACRNVDLAVLAVPVDALPALIARVASALPRGAALLDTGSARRGISAALAAAAAQGVRAVGGHPIAGSEGRGLRAARAMMFRDASFAVMPAAGRVPDVVRTLVREIGARARTVTPAAHDRALARTSHVPYLLARALRDRGARFRQAGLSGPGFRDMTRLAASDPRVAEAYCRANRREVERAWREVRDSMDRRVRALREG